MIYKNYEKLKSSVHKLSPCDHPFTRCLRCLPVTKVKMNCYKRDQMASQPKMFSNFSSVQQLLIT
jgi:hypothetical protein